MKISLPIRYAIALAFNKVIHSEMNRVDPIDSVVIKRKVYSMIEDHINPRDINFDWEDEFGDIVDAKINNLVAKGKAQLIHRDVIPILQGSKFWR